jgi:GNAT superfamily N-acetyltransferase
MASVRLRDIVNSADRAAVMGLRRGPGQDQYLNSMEEIFAEASEEQRAMPHPWAVHDAETGALVGFTMISDNVPQPIDDDLVGPYYLWKLLIDHPFQRRGYGGATLDAVVDYLATRPLFRVDSDEFPAEGDRRWRQRRPAFQCLPERALARHGQHPGRRRPICAGRYPGSNAEPTHTRAGALSTAQVRHRTMISTLRVGLSLHLIAVG